MFKAQNHVFYVFMHNNSEFCIISSIFCVCVCIFMCVQVYMCAHVLACVCVWYTLCIIFISMFSLFDILSYNVFVFFVIKLLIFQEYILVLTVML